MEQGEVEEGGEVEDSCGTKVFKVEDCEAIGTNGG